MSAAAGAFLAGVEAEAEADEAEAALDSVAAESAEVVVADVARVERLVVVAVRVL